MRGHFKLLVVGVFAVFALTIFAANSISRLGSTVSAQTEVTPTPEKPAAEKSPAVVPTPPPAAVDNGKIPAHFTLGQDSLAPEGEVEFNHGTHAFEKYSPDGKSVVGCVECHHTDQPKSALQPPLITSERDSVLTFEIWKKSSQKVSLCRACHFQDGEEPEGKEMPFAVYKTGENETTKELNNEIAYHINCNTCHDAAAAIRPELKKKGGFATSNDCMRCHKEN